MHDFTLSIEDINTILASLEPSYQLVQKETKKRNKNGEVIPRTIQDKYLAQSPVDHCYFGFEQIIEKLQADLKVLKNIAYGEQNFYNFLFPNLDTNEMDLESDKDKICHHYLNSMLRWFFLDISNLLESVIRDLCEIKNVKLSSTADSLVRKIRAIKIEEDKLGQIHKLLIEHEGNHVNFPRYLDQIITTKIGTEFRNFIDALTTIRNSSHNAFYYGAHLKPKELTAFGRTYKFSPSKIIEVNAFHVTYFLVNSIALIGAIDSELNTD